MKRKAWKVILAAVLGFIATLATGMMGIASSMEASDTLASIPVKEWIDVLSTAVSAMCTTLIAYLMKSPREEKT